MAEAALEGCRDTLEGVGEGSWLKSKKASDSGSRHWLLKDDGMVMAGWIAVAMRCGGGGDDGKEKGSSGVEVLLRGVRVGQARHDQKG